jgi:C1A family cysteine protease
MEATDAAIKSMEKIATVQAPLAAPAAVDWRNNGGNWVTSVKDQGSCGSCVAFGTLAALESRVRIACKNANMSIDLSEAHLFYCGCSNCCGTGWNFPPALDFCKNTGVGLETSFPYTPGNQPCKAGVASYTKITAWTNVLSMADRKNIIASKGPVVAGMAVYADFFRYRSGVYKVTSTDLRGYHCICVVGYDDSQKCWICKNSWGTSWGESGFFRIGYGQAKIDTSFAFYDMSVPCPISLCTRYIPYLRSVLLVARRHAMLRACLRYYICGVGRRPLCSLRVIAVVRNVMLILRRGPQYRRPFCSIL